MVAELTDFSLKYFQQGILCNHKTHRVYILITVRPFLLQIQILLILSFLLF